MRLDSKIEYLQSKKSLLDSSIRKMAHRTDQNRLDELIQEKEDTEAAIKEQESIKEGKTQYHNQKLHHAIKRTAENLIEENRVKKRRLGAGPKDKIDDEDEEFLLNCIETKTTAHGRRQDSVLYLNHAVRKSD